MSLTRHNSYPMSLTRIREACRAAWRAACGFARAHRFWSAVIILLVLYGGYRAYAAFTAPSTATRYVTTTVATGTVVAAMSETGQVSASSELSLASKASGQVVAVYVNPGQHVYAGQALAQIDATDAQQALRSAKLALANQELSYTQATATSTLALNLLTAETNVTNAETALQKTHDASYASLASIYSDLSTVLNSLDHALHDSNVTGHATQENIDAFADTVSLQDGSINVFKNSAQTSYDAAVTAYNAALVGYKATPLSAANDEITALADSTYAAVKAVAQATKDTHDFFDRVNTDYTFYNLGTSNTLATLLTTVNGNTTTVNGDLANALTAKSNIVSAEQSLASMQNALAQAEGGANALTVQTATLQLQQAEDAVTNAEQTLADYTVTAPFSGTVAAVSIQQYETIGTGTTVATMVSDNQNVNISVNEVDAAKLAVGQKATITFDALPDVSIAGTVSSVNTIGTVSQGVVSYAAVVTFDTPNASVKPGMSATVDIVTGSDTGLVVPTSAVKTTGGASYIQVFDPPLAGSDAAGGTPSAVPPTRIPVVTGLSDDTNVIIKSGVASGAQVVTQTIAGTATPSAASQSTSLFGGSRSSTGSASTRAILRTGG